MSRRTTSRYVLTQAEIEEMARERRRIVLCAEADALAARHALLANHAQAVEKAFGIATIPLPPLRIVNRGNIDELELFVSSSTRAIAAAEREVSVVSSHARRADTVARLTSLRAADPLTASADPARSSDRAANPVAGRSAVDPPAAPVRDRGAERAERRRQEDLERAAEIIAGVDERALGDLDFSGVSKKLATAEPVRRQALLLALNSDVRALNARVERADEIRRRLAVLSARAEQVGDSSARAAVARAAAPPLDTTQEVVLARAEEAVTHAELVDAQQRRRRRLISDLEAQLVERGCVVMDPAGEDNRRFERLLQDADGSEYAIGLDVDHERVVITTVRIVDAETTGTPADPDAPARRAVCDHIAEVVSMLPSLGVEVTSTDVSGTDVTVMAAPGAVRHTTVRHDDVTPKEMEQPAS